MKQYRILIAGAGLGGLTAASCLMKAGHKVEVYEQAPQLAEIGAGIQVSANAMHVMRHLGLEDALLAVGVKPEAYVFRLHDTGEVVQRFSLSQEELHGAPYTQLHRADLHDLLADRVRELDPAVVRLNHKATGFTETASGVELHFADGRSAKGDILIGADGVKSVVRGQLFGVTPATYTGDAAWRIVVPTERLPKDLLERVMSVFMGPHGHVVCYYLRGGALLNFVGCVETDEVSEESWTVKTPWAISRNTSPAGIRRCRPSSTRPTRTSAICGRCSTGRRSATGARSGSRYSATPPTQPCRISRRARRWRSRTARC